MEENKEQKIIYIEERDITVRGKGSSWTLNMKDERVKKPMNGCKPVPILKGWMLEDGSDNEIRNHAAFDIILSHYVPSINPEEYAGIRAIARQRSKEVPDKTVWRLRIEYYIMWVIVPY
jgi:hypothetical protein